MKRWGTVLGSTLLAGVAALGLTGCGVSERATDTAQRTAVDVVAAMGADGQALAAMGFDTAQIAASDSATGPAADPSAGPADSSAGSADPSAGPARDKDHARLEAWRKRHRARVLLRRNALHGEAVVQTKTGTKTVAVQRGTVTAISDTSMTVKSADGYLETWTFGPKLKVVEWRSTIQPSAIKVGAEVGVAGRKDGDNGVARLVVIPNRK